MKNVQITKQTNKMIYFIVDGKNSRLPIEKFNSLYGNSATATDSTATATDSTVVQQQKLQKHILSSVANDTVNMCKKSIKRLENSVFSAYKSTPNYISIKVACKVCYELDITAKSASVWYKKRLNQKQLDFLNQVNGLQVVNFINDSTGEPTKKSGFDGKIQFSYLYSSDTDLVNHIINDVTTLLTTLDKMLYSQPTNK